MRMIFSHVCDAYDRAVTRLDAPGAARITTVVLGSVKEIFLSMIETATEDLMKRRMKEDETGEGPAGVPDSDNKDKEHSGQQQHYTYRGPTPEIKPGDLEVEELREPEQESDYESEGRI